jgi:hypothetical protein
MSALGTGLIVAAGLIFFFLKLLKVALILGAAGFVILLCAGVALGYKQQGIAEVTAKLQPVIDDLTAKINAQREYAARLVLEQNAISSRASAKAKEIKDATDARFASLYASIKADAKARATPADPSTVGVLDAAISAANATGPAAPAPGTGDSPTGFTPLASESDVATWGATCAQLYAQARSQVIGLQNYYNSLRNAQMAGANP